jgi:deoxyribodipyrimidine photo-lyase
MKVDARRVRLRNDRPVTDGPVVYWMQRDQRVDDNWALLFAQECALERQVPLIVLFNLVPVFGHTTLRHYDFMFNGLAEVEARCAELGIPFFLIEGEPTTTVVAFAEEHAVGHVVTDFNPLRFTDAWRTKVGEALPVRLSEVDAHNIIPCWEASDKEEFAAYTFRPKVQKQLRAWLTDFPPVDKHPHQSVLTPQPIDWAALLASRETDRTVLPVDWITPGHTAGMAALTRFLEVGLVSYDTDRNDPTKNGQSNLSPYFHFGQLSPQRVAYEVMKVTGPYHGRESAYLEELIVRRELADNYCFYNARYDQVAGAHAWAQETIREHDADPREHHYDRAALEAAATHDELWNAMQRQMVREGKLHGWCRMYWAKKILEWTPDAQTAIDEALYLNDKYELDGSDPNGIVGIMWSIAGVHDRAWTERPVFGKIRYMNFAGAKRKFDISAYIARYPAETSLFNES